MYSVPYAQSCALGAETRPTPGASAGVTSWAVRTATHRHTQTDTHTSRSRTHPQGSWLMSSMNLHVEVVILLLGEVLATHGARAALVLAVCAPHMAVVGRVRGEGFAAVLALEGLLPRVLADVSAQDAGCCERLEGQGSSERRWSCK